METVIAFLEEKIASLRGREESHRASERAHKQAADRVLEQIESLETAKRILKATPDVY